MHRVFEAMKHQKYNADGSITIRGGIWQDWLREIQHIQADLDTAQIIIDTTEPVPAEAAQAVVASRARRRSA